MTSERPAVAVPPIRCERFDLVSCTVAFMEAVLARDLHAAASELDIRLPGGEWLNETDPHFRIRLAQIARDPSEHEWLTRAIVLPGREMIGRIGFHGPPDASGTAELGYTIDTPWRRRGYARDAARCMMHWARETHGVRRFRVSIAPDNAPSLAMAAGLGFVRTGEQIDEIDGLEYVFELEIA